MFYPVRTPGIFQLLFSQCIWRIPGEGKEVFLTFDDGPHPEVTGFVLDQLKKFGAKATFFCVGDNVRKYPEMYKRILQEGHGVGNHGYRHLNGWQTSTSDYINDAGMAAQWIQTDFFRPPYGRVRFSQIKALKKQFRYQVVMWNLLSGDFDEGLSPARCAAQVIERMQCRDIMVFHDSEKARKRLEYALPKVLEEISRRGWVCNALPINGLIMR